MRGEPVRKSLDLTSWEAASDLITKWNASGEIGVVKPECPTIADAISKFLDDCVARKLSSATISKHKNLLEKRLIPWVNSEGLRLLKQLDVERLRRFRGTWADAPLTAYKNLERLRGFFYFCVTAEWLRTNPARALKPPKLTHVTERVKVFTQEELKRILAACDRYPERNSFGHDNPERVRAFVLTLQYSGLRIGDCVGLKKSHFDNDRLFLRSSKTGVPVYIPLPGKAVDALEEISNDSEYFFWTGRGLRKSAVADWQRTLRRVFKDAGVTGNPHMFRHTFATGLLSKGADVEIVARLLGHSSSAITLKYYSHWVKERQVLLERTVKALWDAEGAA